jgi:Na+-transporting methylmalonyl-CoA/oxaloacetate decarboxylase gamma subunit
MRAVFGILSLLVVLLIVGSLVKKQMAATTAPIPALQVPSASPSSPAATQREQAQQIQQQVKQAVEAQMQARPMPEDSK